MTLDSLKEVIEAWQKQTFPGATPESCRHHLRRELKELCEVPSDRLEMADIFFLLVAVARTEGVDLAQAVLDKLAINMRREWGKPDAQGVVTHVRPTSPKTIISVVCDYFDMDKEGLMTRTKEARYVKARMLATQLMDEMCGTEGAEVADVWKMDKGTKSYYLKRSRELMKSNPSYRSHYKYLKQLVDAIE